MDIAGLSAVMSQNNLQQQVSLSVTKMALNVQKDQGALIASLAGQTPAPHPYLGASVDISA